MPLKSGVSTERNTERDINRDMKRDLLHAIDPVAWARDRFGFSPDPWQAEVLRSSSKRLLLNCSRQSGKSTVTALLSLHTAIFRPKSLVLCLSPSLRQSTELFRNVSRFYSEIDTVPASSETAMRLELENGSRIISLPGKEQTVRGFASVALLVVDEAARVEDELYYSIRPMLAVSQGRLVALSTPFGTRGWWYEAWISGGPEWERWEIPASKCPRISPEFLEEEKKALGSFWFDQEYCCRFIDAQSQAFRREDVESLFSEEVEEWAI